MNFIAKYSIKRLFLNLKRLATSCSLTRRDTFESFFPSGLPYQHALQEKLRCSEMGLGFRLSKDTTRKIFRQR